MEKPFSFFLLFKQQTFLLHFTILFRFNPIKVYFYEYSLVTTYINVGIEIKIYTVVLAVYSKWVSLNVVNRQHVNIVNQETN